MTVLSFLPASNCTPTSSLLIAGRSRVNFLCSLLFSFSKFPGSYYSYVGYYSRSPSCLKCSVNKIVLSAAAVNESLIALTYSTEQFLSMCGFHLFLSSKLSKLLISAADSYYQRIALNSGELNLMRNSFF